MKDLFCDIERVLPDGGIWCDVKKACTLAAIVVADRPAIVVEIGVWQGGSLIPMLLAMRHVSYGGRAIAIDPWQPSASVDGQLHEADRRWWGAIDHETAYRKFMSRLARHDLASICDVQRMTSNAAAVPYGISMLHIDGNHGEQAVADVERFASSVVLGGVLVLDDLHWTGGAVKRAYARAEELGFAELYPLGEGCVMRRMSLGRGATPRSIVSG